MLKGLKNLIGIRAPTSLELAQQITAAKDLNGFNLEDILKEDTEGEYKGCNALWHLARSDYNSIFGIWDLHKKDIPLNALTKEALDGKHKGKSALWWLSQCAHKDIPSDFVEFWKYYNGFPLSVLLKEVEGGSILAQVLLHDKGAVNFFNLVWERYAQEIPLDSVKLLLLTSAGTSFPVFKILWQNYGSQISLADLLKLHNIPRYNNLSALWNLAWGYRQNVPGTLEALKEILQLSQGRIPQDYLTLMPWSKTFTFEQLITLMNVQASNRTRFDFKGLIDAKNEFYKSLEEQKIESAFQHAKQLTESEGCLNVFFELGEFLLGIDFDKAIKAYLQVPAESVHYDECNLRIANQCYANATAPEASEVKRNYFLRHALTFALRTKEDNRAVLLQNIAFSYTTKGLQRGLGDEIKLWRPWWLEVMDKDSPIDWCLERFHEAAKEDAQIKENEQLKKQINELQKEAQRKDGEIQQLTKTNGDLQKVIIRLMQKEEEHVSPLATNEPLVFSGRGACSISPAQQKSPVEENVSIEQRKLSPPHS